MKKQTCEFIEATTLIPNNWTNWFWGLISESAPFSWGDNNRSLVCCCDFLEHVKNMIDIDDLIEDGCKITQEEYDEFCEKLESLGTTYIDLEN